MFFIGQNLKHAYMTCSFCELLIFFCVTIYIILYIILYIIYIIVWSLFLTASKKYCIYIQTSKETNHEKDTNRYTFLLVSDINVEKTCFFHVELKLMFK